MMTNTTFHFDCDRAISLVMAEEALRAVAAGSTRTMAGRTEKEALRRTAGMAIGQVALALRPYTIDFDPDALTIDVRVSPDAEPIVAFHLAEGALAAFLAGHSDRAVEMAREAKAALRGPVGAARIAPVL